MFKSCKTYVSWFQPRCVNYYFKPYTVVTFASHSRAEKATVITKDYPFDKLLNTRRGHSILFTQKLKHAHFGINSVEFAFFTPLFLSFLLLLYNLHFLHTIANR